MTYLSLTNISLVLIWRCIYHHHNKMASWKVDTIKVDRSDRLSPLVGKPFSHQRSLGIQRGKNDQVR